MPKYINEEGWYSADGSDYNFDDAAETCPCLYRIFLYGTEEKIKFRSIDKKARRQRSLNDIYTADMEKYPYLASLSIAAFNDDPKEKIFVCNGLIESAEWLLTSQSCIDHDSDWCNLTVRSMSPFWSHLGHEHDVVDVVKHSSGLVQLKVWPEFAEAAVPSPPIKYPFSGNWTYAVSFGWNDKMYQESLNFRQKFKRFHVEEWTSINSGSQSIQVCKRCEKFSSKPVLTSCHQLIAMESFGRNMCNGFVDPKTNFVQKLDASDECFLIYRDTHKFNDIEVCQSQIQVERLFPYDLNKSESSLNS
ncbi:uncharacterized protein LOC135122706 [Zophobas morio]